MPNVIRTRTIPDYIREAYLTQKRRREYPRGYFLKVTSDGKRMFPYKDPRSGKVHCGLLRGAITRAAQYGYSDVENRAREMYQRSCKMKEMELVKDDQFSEGVVFGIVYEPGVVDAHGDEIAKDAIEEACWEYNVNFGNSFLSHGMPLSKDDIVILESYVAPTDFEINGRTIKEGTWLMRCRVKNQEIKEMIAEEKIKGFSLGGVVLNGEKA